MSEWNEDSEVTTTYGAIKLAQKQAFDAGVEMERNRIIALIETTLTYQETNLQEYLLKLIKGNR